MSTACALRHQVRFLYMKYRENILRYKSYNKFIVISVRSVYPASDQSVYISLLTLVPTKVEAKGLQFYAKLYETQRLSDVHASAWAGKVLLLHK